MTLLGTLVGGELICQGGSNYITRLLINWFPWNDLTGVQIKCDSNAADWLESLCSWDGTLVSAVNMVGPNLPGPDQFPHVKLVRPGSQEIWSGGPNLLPDQKSHDSPLVGANTYQATVTYVLHDELFVHTRLKQSAGYTVGTRLLSYR